MGIDIRYFFMGVKFFSISPFPIYFCSARTDVMAACSQKLKLTKDELSIARLHGAPAPGLGWPKDG